MRIMSARMSLSENTAAKRMVGLACACAGSAQAAARADAHLERGTTIDLEFQWLLLL